jgi:hypothetical protein
MAKYKLSETNKTDPSTWAKAINIDEIREMVAREAYLRAEQRGFQGGDPVQDWLEAEKKVTEKLKMNA